MNTQQAENLKLNVTRINSYLLKSNKELKKLRKDRISFIRTQEKKEQAKEKEKRIEAPKLGVGRTLGGVKNFLLAGPKSVFDRILDFLGLIVLGTVVTELPNIIKQIDSLLNNSFVKGIVSVFGYMGDRLMSLAQFVGLVDKNEQDQIIKDGEEIGRLSDEINSDFAALDGILKLKEDELKKNDDQDATNESQGPTLQGGDTVTPSQQLSPLPKDNPQKLAKGGTVKEQTSDVKGGTITSSTSVLGSKGLQKARQASDQGFYGYKLAADKFGSLYKKDEDNFTSFTEATENMKKLFDYLSKELLDYRDPTYTRRTTNQQRGQKPKTAPYSPSTTATSGALSAVLPFGDPAFSSAYGWRWGRMHRGIDAGVDANSPVISAQDGKVVDILTSFGGHGDAVVIEHADGTKNVYGHVIPSVSIGDTIKRGQTIAKVKYWPNAYGNKDNTHLHLERIDKSGQHVDSAVYLNSLQTNTQQTQKAGPTAQHQGPVVPKGPKGGDRGNNLVSKTKRGSGQVIIMAVQPVRSYVPMPTPVPMRGGPPQIINHDNSVSSIWRV